MQKLIRLCDCPRDVCRADEPPENCRFIMDPYDRIRDGFKKMPVAKTGKRHQKRTPNKD